MHGANNYPLHKEQSDLDIGLPDGGYSARVATIVEAHAQTFRLAQEVFF